jgi:hypothetical protein
MHTCLACGQKDYDVRLTLIEVPQEEQRVVDVSVVTAEDSHGRPTAMEQRQVRELYATEPRCRDRRACAEREAAALAEWQAQQKRAEPAAQEDTSWLL